jgi:hypothetical protein
MLEAFNSAISTSVWRGLVYLREQKDEVITQLMSRNTIINKKEQNTC